MKMEVGGSHHYSSRM